MKKLLALLLVSMLLLAACSSGSSNGKESKENSADANEITVWAWDPSFNIKALELAKEAYAAENPDLKVNIIENAQDDIVQKLNTSLKFWYY